MALALDIDWTVSEWLTVVGFPAVFVGLVLARKQGKAIDKQATAAASSAEAAKNTALAVQSAVERTEQRLADNHLLIRIPELRLLRRELDLAVDRADRRETIKLLGEWLSIASDVQAILERTDGELHAELISDLERSATLTGKAKDDVIAKRAELEPATRAVRELITQICAKSGKIVGGMKAFTRSSES